VGVLEGELHLDSDLTKDITILLQMAKLLQGWGQSSLAVATWLHIFFLSGGVDTRGEGVQPPLAFSATLATPPFFCGGCMATLVFVRGG
jgi:hypothetical protein